MSSEGGAEGGIQLIRQTFGKLLPKGWSIAQAYLNYRHEHDAEMQVLTFHVIDPDGKPHVIESDKVPARDNVNELAAKTARRFVEGLKDAPSKDPDLFGHNGKPGNDAAG